MEVNAGIRELSKSLSKYIQQVKMGTTITITDRGKPVARLSPIQENVSQELLNLVEEGLACWQGNRPGRVRPVCKKHNKGKNLSEMVSEERR